MTNTTLSSAVAIKSLKAIDWTTGSVTAPSITTLTTTGNFLANVTAAGGSPFSLGTVHVGGQISDDWNITGATSSILVGSVSTGWTGNFSRSINTFTDRAGSFAGSITAGSINSLSITGNDTGHINAGSVKTIRVIGSLSHATITLTGGGVSLGNLIVSGRGSKFVDSDIVASAVGSLSLGMVTTNNGGVPFGITAGTITSLQATLDTGKVLRLSRAQLLSPSAVSAYLTTNSVALGDFVI